MIWFRAAVLAALSIVFSAPYGAAQDITLTSRDGKVELTGTLMGFDGEFYRVETRFGELTVDSSGVTCEGPACPKLAEFVAEMSLTGSSTMAEGLMPALVEGFARHNGYDMRRAQTDQRGISYELALPRDGRVLARFVFHPETTDAGLAALLAGQADAAMALREMRPAEKQAAQQAGLGDLSHSRHGRIISLNAIVPVVSADNPVRQISVPELAKVLAAQIDNWGELGGPDAPISVHLPDQGSGIAQLIEDRILKPAALTGAKDAHRHARSSHVAQSVAEDPFALGVASLAETGDAKALPLTGGCGFAIAADRLAIKTEDYPLNAPMFLYVPARRLPKLAREFLAYARSPAAQMVIRNAGFVDQIPETVGIAEQGQRLSNAIATAGAENSLDELQRLIRALSPMARLTTSFRFETGSSRPDAQSRSNIEQLARALERGEYDARKLLFVGFSDGEGRAQGNRKIALRRAQAVRDAVVKAAETADLDRVDIGVDAFGEAMPMACDDSDWGRQINRRVEVWVQ